MILVTAYPDDDRPDPRAEGWGGLLPSEAS